MEDGSGENPSKKAHVDRPVPPTQPSSEAVASAPPQAPLPPFLGLVNVTDAADDLKDMQKVVANGAITFNDSFNEEGVSTKLPHRWMAAPPEPRNPRIGKGRSCHGLYCELSL